jgi:hypothetical protein
MVSIFPVKRHKAVGKETSQTCYIERFNCKMLQRVSRLVQKTLSFSKKLQNHIGAIWLYISRTTPADVLQNKRPTGSGVTEAGCKVIIKARLCAAGMKWKEFGASIVLRLRTLSYSTGRWQ